MDNICSSIKRKGMISIYGTVVLFFIFSICIASMVLIMKNSEVRSVEDSMIEMDMKGEINKCAVLDLAYKSMKNSCENCRYDDIGKKMDSIYDDFYKKIEGEHFFDGIKIKIVRYGGISNSTSQKTHTTKWQVTSYDKDSRGSMAKRYSFIILTVKEPERDDLKKGLDDVNIKNCCGMDEDLDIRNIDGFKNTTVENYEKEDSVDEIIHVSNSEIRRLISIK